MIRRGDFMVVRGDWSVALFLAVSEMNRQHAPPTGDHEGPPNPTSSSLAPTDGDGLFLRLMRIGRPPRDGVIALLYSLQRPDRRLRIE